jgi:hypothetical protein
MPYPFSNLLEASVKKHVAQDLSLDMAHKFYLPDEILNKENLVVLLFKCEGKDKYEKLKTLLANYLLLINEGIFSEKRADYTKSYKYLFTFDFDANNLEGIVEAVTKNLKVIGEYDFITKSWEDTCSPFGRMSNDKAIYAWGDNPSSGTLEDILMSIIKSDKGNKDLIEKSEKMMDDLFSWDIENPIAKKRIPEIARYKKSVITAAGQRVNPGKSLSVIIKESGLITEESLRASGKVKEFVDFLNGFLGNV